MLWETVTQASFLLTLKKSETKTDSNKISLNLSSKNHTALNSSEPSFNYNIITVLFLIQI